jgi:sorting nexin-3/12
LKPQIVVPCLPSKALKRQMPFRGDDGIYEEGFIEERRAGLEGFVNKIAGHPLAQNERCLHMFLQVIISIIIVIVVFIVIILLQEPNIDRNYVPGKIRNT